MKKLLLSTFFALFLVQFFTYGQTKLTQRAPATKKASVCDGVKSQIKKIGDNYTVSLKSNDKIDDWVLIPELDQENPLRQRRNQISTPKDGKYILAVLMKGQDETCGAEIILSESISRGGLNAGAGSGFLKNVCKDNPYWYLCISRKKSTKKPYWYNKWRRN